MAIVTEHGANSTSKLLQLFEGYLDAKDVADEESYDRVREGVVVFLGTLAQHLDPAEKKVMLLHGATGIGIGTECMPSLIKVATLAKVAMSHMHSCS